MTDLPFKVAPLKRAYFMMINPRWCASSVDLDNRHEPAIPLTECRRLWSATVCHANDAACFKWRKRVPVPKRQVIQVRASDSIERDWIIEISVRGKSCKVAVSQPNSNASTLPLLHPFRRIFRRPSGGERTGKQ